MTRRPHLVERAVEALQEDAGRNRHAGARAAIAPGLPAASAEAKPAPAPAPNPAIVGMAALEQAGLMPRPRTGARSRLAEEIALIRHQVLRGIPTLPAGDQRCARMVMVTSARPGEGKTFTALNVAAAIADGESTPVLLVDIDGRRGSLGELLGLAGQPGLRALASAPSIAPASLTRETAVPRLAVMTNEDVPGNSVVPPAESLAGAVRRLAAAFPGHIIVLDMPPALSTADAGALAPIVGQVMMVVLAEKTQRNEVEAALDVVEACPEIRLLLNRAGLTLNDSFGAHGGYDGYGSPQLP